MRKKIIDLATMASSKSSAKIALSSLVCRSDDEALACKISGVNKILEESCRQNSWGFVDHSNILGNYHLNRSGLHLNKSGTSRLARNFTNYLRLNYDIAVWESDLPDASTSDNRGKFNYTSVLGRGLAIASLNINSLPSHIDELRVFISCFKVDILIINESKLDSTIHDNELYLPGFEVVRRERRVNERKGGGVCIYLRTNLNFRVRGDLNNDNLDCLFR